VVVVVVIVVVVVVVVVSRSSSSTSTFVVVILKPVRKYPVKHPKTHKYCRFIPWKHSTTKTSTASAQLDGTL